MSAEEARLRANPKMRAFLKSEPLFTVGLDGLANERTRVMLLRSVTVALETVAAKRKSK